MRLLTVFMVGLTICAAIDWAFGRVDPFEEPQRFVKRVLLQTLACLVFGKLADILVYGGSNPIP